MTTVEAPSSPPAGEHPFESLPSIVLRRAATTPDVIAIREKDRGRWTTYTWGTYGERMVAVARGLHELGVEAGDRVAIHSENCPPWLFADMGAR